MESKIVHAAVFDPSDSLFKQPANTKAELRTVSCCLESCPLRDAGTCALTPILGWHKCPYGEYNCETGPTKRSGTFHTWICEQKKKVAGIPRLGTPPRKMAFVGEYVYLPYSHMTMCREVPFLAHGNAFSKDNCFLPREHWTFETVQRLINFNPQALFGGEITSYHKEQVPKFLAHLRECDPVMWDELITWNPQYDKSPDYVGRRAIVRTLKPGISWTQTSSEGKYPVSWRWDGMSMTTESIHAYSSTWGGVEAETASISIVPAEDASIVVKDNSWVTPETVFID